MLTYFVYHNITPFEKKGAVRGLTTRAIQQALKNNGWLYNLDQCVVETPRNVLVASQIVATSQIVAGDSL